MSDRRILTLLAAAAVLAASVHSGRVEAQGTCEWYAKTALRQQQENEQRRCGFKGPEWNADLKAHLAWCAVVPPDLWKQQAQKRDQALAQCARRS
jgi:hypothetical protein